MIYLTTGLEDDEKEEGGVLVVCLSGCVWAAAQWRRLGGWAADLVR